MRRQDDVRDAAALAQLLARDQGLLGLEVTRLAHGRTVVEVVTTVREQTTLDDVVGVELGTEIPTSRAPAAHSPIPGEDGLAKLVSCE
jgi:hypothetical protein